MLDLVLVLCTLKSPNAAAGPALVGIVREPRAYCAFAEIGDRNSQYQVVMQDGYDELIRALNGGGLDAGILPVQYLERLDPDEYVVMAVTSSLNLVAVGDNGAAVYALGDLDGRAVTVPESLRNSRELRMLSALIAKTGANIHILYRDDETILRGEPQDGSEIFFLSPEQCAGLLLRSSVYKSYFTLVGQWEALAGTPPPAGSCIVARKAGMEIKGSGMSAFLTGVKASVEFLNSKHKKAATLIAASGFDQDVAFIWKVLPYYAFCYLDGAGMAQSLESF